MGIKNHDKQDKEKLEDLKDGLCVGLFFVGVPVILLCLVVYLVSDAFGYIEDKRAKAESVRYEVVSKELNVSQKHLLVEKRVFSDLYEVNANGDHYLVEFNDDCTKLKRIVKDSK
ncbi:hypothetical protein P4U97_01165 [Bacillus swezeyi]|uniref:hypothetical protein n=1 Tax=Bacillus swezeyi TaxID=1925020 RepID=UPI002E2019C8|nr:hypothetical protein [Bacillus swezeyi]